MHKVVAVASVAFLGFTASAQAGTVVSSFTSVPGYSNSLPAIITFEDGPALFVADDAALGFDWTGTAILRGPPSTFDSADPAGDTSNWYMSILAGKEEVLTFDPALYPDGIKSFQLFIGSVDTYNSITFFSGGLSQVIDGTTLLDSVAPGNDVNSGNRASDLTNRLYKFTFNNNTGVTKIVFDSTIDSLEFDNLSAVVGVGTTGGGGGIPEPTTWVVMIAGFGLLGTLMRRRSGARALALS
jgi:hypothetical protein